ncbi:glutamate-1-semialdehyde 2,1-aminomutase 2, chloroplastic [Fagus crenata]
MAGAVAGVGVGLGLSCSTTTKLSQRRSSSSKTTSRCCVKVAVSLDEKKKNYTLQKSEEAFAAAKDLMPGGVNSPVRAFKSVGGQPIILDSVKGSCMWDIDGNEYIDNVGSWGPAIIGHADDEVLAALAETMKKGTSFGAPCLLENVLAEMVISAVPSIEMVRMVNSGTEACMGVLRLARAFTGKERIIKFEGCYDGHADPFLVKAGSGVATLGLPDSPGVPKGATYETLTAPFNDISAVENLFETNKGELLQLSLNLLLGTLVSLLLNLNSLMPYAKSLKKMVLS